MLVSSRSTPIISSCIFSILNFFAHCLWYIIDSFTFYDTSLTVCTVSFLVSRSVILHFPTFFTLVRFIKFVFSKKATKIKRNRSSHQFWSYKSWSEYHLDGQKWRMTDWPIKWDAKGIQKSFIFLIGIKMSSKLLHCIWHFNSNKKYKWLLDPFCIPFGKSVSHPPLLAV